MQSRRIRAAGGPLTLAAAARAAAVTAQAKGNSRSAYDRRSSATRSPDPVDEWPQACIQRQAGRPAS